MVSEVWNSRSEAPSSSRTTKTTWLRARWPVLAHELGEVDARDRVAGTAHDAETPQLPQSTRPVAASVRQAGWAWGSAAQGSTVATLRAPLPP